MQLVPSGASFSATARGNPPGRALALPSRVNRATDLALHEEAEALAHVGTFAAGLDPTASAYWSTECRRILGVSLDAVVHTEMFWNLVHLDDREELSRARRVALENREAYDVTFRVRRASDGEVRWVQSKARPVLDDTGAIVEVVGVFQDITEKRAACEQLRAVNTRFARLSQSGIVGIAVGHRLGRVLEANDAYLGMIGYTRDELEQGLVRWTEITPPEHHDADEAAGAQLKELGIARVWEKEYIRKDGTRVPILIGLAALDDDTRIVVANDLTERKQVETALKRSEEKLIQAQKMEAIGLLAGGVAHDFNNMLSVILSYSVMLSSDLRPSDPMFADLGEIAAAGRRAAELTRQLLAFSCQQVLEPRVVDLTETLSGLEKMLRRLIGEDIALTVDGSQAELRNVEVDPGQIEQVIMNLVVNARDAMPMGGSLTIEMSNLDVDAARAATVTGLKPGPYVQISVRDTGHGMSRETVKRIFEPFFTMKPKGKGTGLGLSSSLGIVQQSGGAIAVESELGRGTTFFVYLPVTSAASRPQAAHGTGPVQLRGKETILLVEDEDRVRNMVRAILRRYGYDVLEARNGGEALLTCEQHAGTIHAMLSDVVMPMMSGPQLAGRLRAIRPDMRVTFMSGYAEGAAGAEDLGVRGSFVQKPFTPDVLVSALRATLDASEA